MSRRIALLSLLVLLSLHSPTSAADHVQFSDAECLAVSISDSLLPPDTLITRIDHDLALIRQHTPAAALVHFSCADPQPGVVEIDIYYAAKQLFLAGQHPGMNELHARLGVPEVWWAMEYTAYLHFSRPYNPQRLVELYSAIWGVWDSNTTRACSGYGRDLEIRPDGAFVFHYSWGGECWEGICDKSHTWIFRVDGEVVTLLEESGDLIPVERVSWGTVKALFR